MKILVFGGVGFIGTNISIVGLDRGHTIVAFDNLSRTGVIENLQLLQSKKNFSFIHGDIRNVQDFDTIPHDIDVIINLAANPSVPKSILRPKFDFEINVIGHLNVLNYALQHGKIPVILASSNKVYTDQINTIKLHEDASRFRVIDKYLQKGFDENTDVDGHQGFTNSPYGVAKLAAEKYSREYWRNYRLPIVINRMSCIYGEYQKGVEKQGWVDWFVRAKRNEYPLTIFGNGKQVRDVLFGKDVAELYLYEAEHIQKVNGKTFNVGGGARDGFHTSLLEIIYLLDSEFKGKKLTYLCKPWRKSDQKYYISDISYVTSQTGWKPKTTLISGLKRMWSDYS